MRSIDKRAGRSDGERPALVGETISQYFRPEVSMKAVTRGELSSILLRYTEAQKARRWYRRWWTWTKRCVRPFVDMVDFLHVLREEDAAVQAIAKETGTEVKPL